MSAVTSQGTNNTDLPELVRDSMLPVVIERNLTIHPQPFTRRNKSRQERWVREKNLGRGGYGEVWLEKKIEVDDNLPKLRAVKTIRIPENETIFQLNGGRGVRELEALAKFSQDNYKDFFVKSYGWYLAPGSLNIAMEYCRHGDLKGHLERVKTIPTQEVQEIALQILGALVSMHRNGFAHRDLKPANILIKSKPPQDWWVKLCDFGLSKRQEGMDEASTVRGTPSFMPPETLGFPFTGDPKKANPYSADLWCFGETLYRCHVGGATFEDKEQLYEYQRGNRLFPVEKLQQVRASGLATNFIHFLMLPNPAERLDTERARRHPWLRGEVEPPSGQNTTNTYRSSRKQTGPARVGTNLTAQPAISPSPAVETQLTEASGQWTTTATNPSLHLRRIISQLSLVDNPPTMASPAFYGDSPAYNRPDIIPSYLGYPGYPPTPATSHYVQAGTGQGRIIDEGTEWTPSHLSQRFQRQVDAKHLDGSETQMPKKKSRPREKKQPKVRQAPTRRATPPPKPRQSNHNLTQAGAIAPSLHDSVRQPQRTPNQEQSYLATPTAVIRQPSLSAIGPGQGFHTRRSPPAPAPAPGTHLSPSGWADDSLKNFLTTDSRNNTDPLEILSAGPDSYRRSATNPDDTLWDFLTANSRNHTDPLEILRAGLDPYRSRATNPEEYGLPPRIRAQPSDRPPAPADLPPLYYRPTQRGLGTRQREGNQPALSGNASYEARPVYDAYSVDMSIYMPRSGQVLRRARSHHSPPPPPARSTTQYPAGRSVDRRPHRDRSSPDSVDEADDEKGVGVSVPLDSWVISTLKNNRVDEKNGRGEVPLTVEHFGG
ncbi:Protein kinase-like domain containing protein [Rhypophila sp. PSN 637]